MNGENDLDHSVEGDALHVSVVCVGREEVLQIINEIKTGKVPGPAYPSLELIASTGRVGIQLMAEICQRVLDGFGMLVELALSIVAPIIKGKGDIRNRSYHGAVYLVEHAMKVVERVFEKMLCIIASVD